MPIVAPKIKVVRVTNTVPSVPPIINPSTGQPYKRFGPYVDLGIINAFDIYVTGIIELIPFVPGRIIHEIYFTPDEYVPTDGPNNIVLAMPNYIATDSSGPFGMAIWSNTADGITDTMGLFLLGEGLGVGGLFGSINLARFCGPLFACASAVPRYFGAWKTWTAVTRFSVNEQILKSGRLWYVSTNGITGVTEPVWSGNDPITDGTVVWTLDTATPTTGQLHIHAVVSDEPPFSVPIPDSLEFIQQPTNVAAGGTMSPPVTIRVLDQDGNPFTFQPVTILLNTAGDGDDSNATSTTDTTTGIATFSSLSFTNPGTGLVLRAQLQWGINITPIDSDPFNVT